jgi:transcriptional regulator with XRE-family HTH domain
MVKQEQSPYAELMFRAGVTQKDIAECLGYSQNAVNAWFRGKVVPRLSLEEWHKIAELHGTTIEKLPLSFAPQPIHDTSESASN